MTILHAHSNPRFATHLHAILAAANAHPHSVDIAVGCYFYLSGFAQVSDLLATRPGKVRILIGRTHRPTLEQIAPGLSAGDTLALLANGGVRQGCRVDAGLAVLRDGYCRQPRFAAGRFAPTQPKPRGLARQRSPWAGKTPRLPCSPHPLIPAAPAPPPRRTAESTAAPVPPAPCHPDSAP